MTSIHLPQNKKAFAILLLILGSVTAIGPLSIDMYLPAFSAIGFDFNAAESKVQLSLTAYFIGLALSQLFYGPITDRFGRKIPLFFGLTIFVFSSIACCFAHSIDQLIVLRFFQALGACAGMVVPRAIVRDIFTPQESARVFSHLMLVMGIAPILAPIVGSMLLIHFGWKSIFVFLAAFGILCLLVSYFAIPQTKGPNVDDKISGALKKYLGILQDRNFVICAVSGGLTMSGLFAYITGSPFVYLQYFELSAETYSLIFAINSVGFIVSAQINAYFLKKFSMRQILSKVIFIPAITGLALMFIGLNNPTFWPFTITLFIFLCGVGAIVPNATALALSNQSQYTGSASALLGMLQFSLATIASFTVSMLHDESTTSMIFVIGVFGIMACLVFKLFNPSAKSHLN